MNIFRTTAFVVAGAACWGASVAVAQDRVTVPLSSPNQPATVKAHLISGSITLTAGSGSQVVVEYQSDPSGIRIGGQSRPRTTTPPPGMHRIDIGATGLNVQEDRNIVTIRTSPMGHRGDNLIIQVPVNTSVELRTVTGNHIDVSGINGDIDVEATNGEVTLKDVSGSVVAHTLNGNVTVSLAKISADKPMSFTSLNGKVDVTLPADTKARLRLKTSNGSVFSDFDVKMEPDSNKPVVEDGRGRGGRYRIRMDRSVYGSINGGGPEFLFQTMNGDILIHKK
jgi:hypothetical protein